MNYIRPGELFMERADLEIRQVANGWILYLNNPEYGGASTRGCYVFSDPERMAAFIAKHAKISEKAKEEQK